MAQLLFESAHNQIAQLEKKARFPELHAVMDFLAGSSIHFAIIVDPQVLEPQLREFWGTASETKFDGIPNIQAIVAGRHILITEATIRNDLMFDDEDSVE